MEQLNPNEILFYLKNSDNLYGFQFGNGDSWGIKLLPITTKEVLEQLDSNHNKSSHNIASINYKTESKEDAVIVFTSIMFPDGRIWDGSKRSFRGEFKTINF